MEASKAQCCHCENDAYYRPCGLRFCTYHYKEFLQAKLYKHIKASNLDAKCNYYIDDSQYNEIMVEALFRYFKHNPEMFERLRFKHGCANFEYHYKRAYGRTADQVFVDSNTTGDTELIAIPGYLLAVEVFTSVAHGDIMSYIARFYDRKSVFLLEDLSLDDCVLLGAAYRCYNFGPALLESSLEYRQVLGCLRRIRLHQ